jgi:hypothetical protein
MEFGYQFNDISVGFTKIQIFVCDVAFPSHMRRLAVAFCASSVVRCSALAFGEMDVTPAAGRTDRRPIWRNEINVWHERLEGE